MTGRGIINQSLRANRSTSATRMPDMAASAVCDSDTTGPRAYVPDTACPYRVPHITQSPCGHNTHVHTSGPALRALGE
ncbi:hypothetical protein Gain_0291_025 [Komagataeibacter intermedius TF2]|uniref:Uncharacterized protein n=1 Tax=Komagataeibacter intermedius NRIC 0521 TaxID=1307934 RepID=A0ABQ0PDY2_9PROT|nr:hypothetical protein Gain_0291_025 [Komagataeibacter intermedius TF2]GBQ64425.1 hypothetical protein AA0521_0168 [Komagataeibacter intermedius NRIC 0521]